MNLSQKILIIEDEKTLARALEIKLVKAGFDVRVVFNGEDGITLLEKDTFDLILLDLIMPKMDGFGVLNSLLEKKIKIPVIVLSNLSHESDMKKAREFGAREFYIKSNTPLNVIIEKVKKILK
ncbi:MAG: response regulator [Candidatus Pacebacteria bacterium]|nr:response regulator [Candidatus Paceibacterota bacterium]